jgi:hypothetical protein
MYQFERGGGHERESSASNVALLPTLFKQ